MYGQLPPERRASLAGSARAALRARLARPRDERPVEGARIVWPVAAGIAALLAAAPLATIAGAHWLAGRERAQAVALDARLAPKLAAEASDAAARTLLRDLLRRPTLGASLERFARALPDDAHAARIAMTDGALEAEIAAADPDRLRAALHRDPVLARLRETGQRRADTEMLVTLRAAP
jgi:hypothetical protein